MSKQIILEVKKLSVHFQKNSTAIKAVEDINIIVYEGKVTSIIGESGSGKSQSMLAIMGLTDGKPGIVDGEIYFENKNLLADIPPIKEGDKYNYKKLNKWVGIREKEFQNIRGSKVAMIFQDPRASLIPYYTIKKQAWETWSKINNNNKDLFLERVRYLSEALQFQNVDRLLNSYPNQLSGGEAQRAYILLSLLGKPKLVIADEPTSSLDPATSSSIIKLLIDLSQKENFSLLLISHSLGQVIEISDYIYVFLNGCIVEEMELNSKKEVNAWHPYTKFLLSMAKGKAFSDLRTTNDVNQEFNQLKKHGCPYQSICTLKDEKEVEFQEKCANQRPSLVQHNNGKVACWYYE